MQQASSFAHRLLSQEASGLLTRLARLKPFCLSMPMTAAASVPPEALDAIEGLLSKGRKELRRAIGGYLHWLSSEQGRKATAAEAQRKFTFLRLRFNSIISQCDIFGDVLAQRSEHETGAWVAGLDDLAADALLLPGKDFVPPPVICYLDRGHGAAIRRTRTRLPGGDDNPVAVIRVPRERMVGSGIASSLVHEVGHQGAAMLDLVSSLRGAMPKPASAASPNGRSWVYWSRCISEIVADLWSVARIGVASTLGLIGVVSLPRPFVFRLDLDDPHPAPFLRVKLSAAIGQALYPHSQWQRLAAVWESLYPLDGLAPPLRASLEQLQRDIPEFVTFLLAHRPSALRGKSVREALTIHECRPESLNRLFLEWRANPGTLSTARPCLVFAVIGQAKANGAISPEHESELLSKLLSWWALQSALKNAKRKPGLAETPVKALARNSL